MKISAPLVQASHRAHRLPMWRLVCNIAASIVITLLAASSCSNSEECAQKLPNGQCAKTCTDSGCAAGERCVQSECRPACTNQARCPTGQNCVGWGFADGSQGYYCVVMPYAETGRTGQFEACAGDAECDTLRGFRCVEGECRFPCHSHFECAGVGTCEPFTLSSGTREHYCKRGAVQPAGQFYTHCPNRTECDVSAGFTCLGQGQADLDAYCTRDCTADTDCASGFTCSTVFRAPCEAVCDFAARAKDPTCVPADQIGEGKPWQCSERGITRKLCVARSFCDACETDVDCGAVANQICARDSSGQKLCTTLCDAGTGSCPWGNAGSCAVWDQELGVPTCAHRFGSCKGTGKPCEPCVRNEDCGQGLCVNSSFTGERWCVSLDVKCDCGDAGANGLCVGGGCPKAPSGLDMLCIADGSFLDGRCYAAQTAQNPIFDSPQTGCWGF